MRTEKQQRLDIICNLLQEKIPARPLGQFYGLAGRWINRFGFNQVRGVLGHLRDMREYPGAVGVIEKELQKQDIGRTAHKNLIEADMADLAGMIGH
jgi:hypothetical protein